ncbi:MAG TPA: toll/interleukin-1 receptor domain-containing protein [Anaerolineales bacterium]|nr:toll/interleukin-1 receptor domain-containing protein [Anaerolineales bacterium]
MKHIFISYSRIDDEAVDHIVARLEQDGFHVWIDREEIKAGELWQEAIVQAIDNAYAVVFMLSPGSATSENVRKEIDLAEDTKKELIPVLLVPVELPANLRYQLAGIQRIEYYRDPEAKYSELVAALQAHQQKFSSCAMPKLLDMELTVGNIKISTLGPEIQEELLN